jgi:O-antigen ligase
MLGIGVKTLFLSSIVNAIKDGLNTPWKAAQFGIICLPLSPFLGAMGLGWAMLSVCRQQFSTLCRQPINQGFAILAGWLILASFFAEKPLDSFLGLFNFLPFFLLFASLTNLIQTVEQLRRIIWLFVLGSIPVVIIGFGQLFWGWQGPVQFLAIVINWPLAANGNPAGRMSSVFEYANVLASYLVITFCLSVGLWVEKYLEWNFQKQSKIFNLSKTFFWQWLFLTTVVIANAGALILTNSRNAWGLAGITCLIFALYLGWNWLVAAVIAGAGMILGSAFFPNPLRSPLRQIVPAYFWQRLTDELYQRPLPTLRTTQWEFAWNMTLERPFIGWGFRHFPRHYFEYFSPLYQGQPLEWPQHPHNLILMLFAEAGVPATLLFCALAGWILAQGILSLKNWKIPDNSETYLKENQDKLIFFTYLLAFSTLTIFHLFDVTLFDLRINLIGWVLLSVILLKKN